MLLQFFSSRGQKADYHHSLLGEDRPRHRDVQRFFLLMAFTHGEPQRGCATCGGGIYGTPRTLGCQCSVLPPPNQALSATCQSEGGQRMEMFANPGLLWQIAVTGNRTCCEAFGFASSSTSLFICFLSSKKKREKSPFFLASLF